MASTMPDSPAKSHLKKAPTIIDIARVAGTSKSTVSNVLRGKAHVEPATRARVLQVSEELGYRINIAARHLRQRPRVLGVVVGDLRNPFDAEMAAFIEQAATAASYTILLVTTNGSAERERQRLKVLLEHRVAAVLFVSFSGARSVLSALEHDTPWLFVSCRGSGGTSISVDEREGARLAVEHLAALGHRRISYVSTTLAHQPRMDAARYAGYTRAMKALGLQAGGLPGVRLKAGEDGSEDAVHARLREMLAGEDRPSAIYAASDFTAVEVMDAADAVGLRVPRELSIVGFDDIALARLTRISLTTVAQPTVQLAERAVQAAIEQIEVGAAGRSYSLAPRLMARGSTARLRDAATGGARVRGSARRR
jgi:LacI family transcriptional regulator